MLSVQQRSVIVEVPEELMRQLRTFLQRLTEAQGIPMTMPGTSLPDLLQSLGRSQEASVQSLSVRSAWPALPEIPEAQAISELQQEPSAQPSAADAVTEPRGIQSPQEEWDALEAKARRCRKARIQAEKEEREAYEQVLAFSEHPDHRVRNVASRDFLQKVAKAMEKMDYFRKAEERWSQYQQEEEKRLALLKEQQSKLKELEALRAQLHVLETSTAEFRRSNDPSREPQGPRAPGPSAEQYRNAVMPCDKWGGPRPDLLYIRYCQVCNLSGISRTNNCPNYYLHHKFRQGIFETYKY